MKFHTFSLALVLVVLGELIQTRDAYKSIRPYKYYRPRPRGHKPGWHQFSRPSGYRHLKKRPPKPHYRRQNSARPGPRYAPDYIGNEQSYTIEIELPKRQHGYSKINGPYHRNYNPDESIDNLYADDDYLQEEEEEEDFEERVLRTGKKKVRIKVIKGVKPKLQIKIERNDNLAELKNAATTPIGENTLQTNSPISLNDLGLIVDSKYMPENPVPSYPEALRGA